MIVETMLDNQEQQQIIEYITIDNQSTALTFKTDREILQIYIQRTTGSKGINTLNIDFEYDDMIKQSVTHL